MKNQVMNVAKGTLVGIAIGIGAGVAISSRCKKEEKGPVKKAASKVVGALGNLIDNMECLTK